MARSDALCNGTHSPPAPEKPYIVWNSEESVESEHQDTPRFVCCLDTPRFAEQLCCFERMAPLCCREEPETCAAGRPKLEAWRTSLSPSGYKTCELGGPVEASNPRENHVIRKLRTSCSQRIPASDPQRARRASELPNTCRTLDQKLLAPLPRSLAEMGHCSSSSASIWPISGRKFADLTPANCGSSLVDIHRSCP